MLSLVAALLLLPPDPRLAHAWRKSEAGWIYAHLEGEPREIGYQYGSLLAPEIADAQAALKSQLRAETGKDWDFYRQTAKTLFWNKLDPEYRQEIEGQAEGLAAHGVHADAWDVLAFNGYIEIEQYYLPWLAHRPTKQESCSAFVATGSYTKDGRVVMGQNLWWDYLMGERFDVMLDITPRHGNRIVMDALPGFIHSGSDFAVNSKGLLVTETTIAGFEGFDPNGVPEFERMRKATQYADDLDQWVAIMEKGNNGGYANGWLIADTKTNEIGKLELGLKNVTYRHTRDGYFVGSNFPENPKLIAEEIPDGWDPDPARNGCEARRRRWCALLDGDKGQIDADKAKTYLADTYDPARNLHTPSDGSLMNKGSDDGTCNSLVATSALAANLRLWIRMGFSDGSALKFGPRRASPYLRDIPAEPWVLYGGKS